MVASLTAGFARAICGSMTSCQTVKTQPLAVKCLLCSCQICHVCAFHGFVIFTAEHGTKWFGIFSTHVVHGLL